MSDPPDGEVQASGLPPEDTSQCTGHQLADRTYVKDATEVGLLRQPGLRRVANQRHLTKPRPSDIAVRRMYLPLHRLGHERSGVDSAGLWRTVKWAFLIDRRTWAGFEDGRPSRIQLMNDRPKLKSGGPGLRGRIQESAKSGSAGAGRVRQLSCPFVYSAKYFRTFAAIWRFVMFISCGDCEPRPSVASSYAARATAGERPGAALIHSIRRSTSNTSGLSAKQSAFTGGGSR